MPSEEKLIIKSDIKKYASLESVARSEGGLILIKSLKSDIVAFLGLLRNQYTELSEANLRATCGILNDRINLYQTLTNAKNNKKGASKALEELLKEEPDELN